MENKVLTPLGQECLQSLLKIWLDFDFSLNNVPVVKRLEQGRLSLEDYQTLLLNLRQQVIEGSRWISRSASSFDRDYSDIRSIVIGHASEEHRDYLLLEQDYVATGGNVEDIQSAKKNMGSEALHGFLMYRASQPNPIDLIGAMWIIEGLGNKMALKWSKCINEQFTFDQSATSFMDYHGENDEHHLAELYKLIDRVATSEKNIENITRTAKVVAKLYKLQLEEVDNDE
ncbi:iron-containing redox enzyme family protein [Colwellia sp. E2M01]|uniref:iron-containing redox enzyme family protein n=1 Tax=Colwellia sp. E2M01 TaxID=2841561 RepID=UPI001C086B41|nr:iron-containing redox enzyme family protein [Colwellia sp. E2M01]MBU2872274.1 iron-containing redox enzyme family protein [Colwellia sp. E2M01]